MVEMKADFLDVEWESRVDYPRPYVQYRVIRIHRVSFLFTSLFNQTDLLSAYPPSLAQCTRLLHVCPILLRSSMLPKDINQ